MKNWRTNICGVMTLVGGLLPGFWPELAKLGGFLVALGAGLGHLFAQDSRREPRDPDVPPPPVTPKTFLVIAAIMLYLITMTARSIHG